MIKKTLTQYKREIIIAVLAILLLSVWTCSNNRQKTLQGEYNILKEQYQTQKDGVKVIEESRRKEKDSINKENKKLQEETIQSEKRVAQLEDNIQSLRKQTQKQKEQLKNMSYVQLAQEINKEFNSNEASATNNSVDLKGDLPGLVLEIVYDANECQAIVTDKDKQLKEKDSQIDNTKRELKNTSVLLFSAEKEIKAKDLLQQTADKNINNLEKQVKNLKVKNFITTYVITPLAVFAGFKIGQKK